MDAAAWKGFRQLVSYWKRIRTTSAAEIGFGVVCVFKYDNRMNSKPLIRWHIFFPEDQPGIAVELADDDVVKDAKNVFSEANLIHGV